MKPIYVRFSQRRAFTLVEIMIVVAILALLVSLAVPNVLRARKRSQATRTLSDLRTLDASLDRWALEHNKPGSAVATFDDLRFYLKPGSPLYSTGADVLGNPLGPNFVVDQGIKVPDATYQALSDVAPASFWSPFK